MNEKKSLHEYDQRKIPIVNMYRNENESNKVKLLFSDLKIITNKYLWISEKEIHKRMCHSIFRDTQFSVTLCEKKL